jgi:hypothetical protein
MIDWKKRIQKGDTHIDLTALPNYTLKFGATSTKEIIYDVECFIPEAPADEDCINYNLDPYDQIFRWTYIPDQARYPDKDFGRDNWSERDLDIFVAVEHHRRRNGVWFFIKGKKTYIPGQLYYKMNYWKAMTGEEFLYRDSDREMYTFLLNATHDPKCRGVVDFKCRQLGDTENAICYMYERGSRIRGSLHTLQSFVNEDHVIETYDRLTYGHANMMWYMKPMNRGTENPKKGLILTYPPKHITHASIQKSNEEGGMVNKSSLEDYEYPPLGSRFRYGPSKPTRFDGSTGICTAYGDEFGKPTSGMDPNNWAATMAEATFSSIRGVKRGMIIMTSTLEDITEDGLEWCVTLYKESDPSKKLQSGSTLNGLWRIFRGVAERGFDGIVADRWGFIDKEAVIAAVTEKYNAMIEAGNTAGAMGFIRKNPRKIEDVFMSIRNSSPFHVENLRKREFYLNEVAHPKPWVRGNLKWKDGIRDTTVIWEPNPKGKWEISRHPEYYNLEDNKRASGFASKPGNTHAFCAGIDPIDQNETLASESERSKGAIVLMRKFDDNVDKEQSLYYQFNDEVTGIVKGTPVDLGSNFETNRVCCTYMERPADPAEFFEDVILTMVYFGSDFLPEKNKYGGLKTYLKMRGYAGYEMDRPTDVKNYKGQTEKGGVTATENSISMYFDFITTYTCNMANAIDHPVLLSQLITMNWKNRSHRDLGVAFGWALYASMQKKPRWHGDRQKRAIVHFTENYV